MAKQHFIRSTLEPFENSTCHKCGLIIREVQDGVMFWNPNPRAYQRNICSNCYDVWLRDKEEGYRRWRDRHAMLEAEKTGEKE